MLERFGVLGIAFIGSSLLGACSSADEDLECSNSAELEGGVPADNGMQLDFDSATATIRFSESAGDNDCVYEVELHLTKGGDFDGCSLRLKTTPLLDSQSRLLITTVRLSADTSTCPTWGLEALIHETEGSGPWGTVELLGSIEPSDFEACYRGQAIVELDQVVLEDVIDPPITLGPATLTLDLEVTSFGDPASCATPQ